jgi:hypothetical protein
LIELDKLKADVLRLLREDEEFRYAVAGLIGLGEILKRLDAHDAKFVEILKRLDAHDAKFVEILKRLDAHDAKFVEILKRLDAHEAELVKLRKDMLRGFKRHDEILKRHSEEIAKLRDDMITGFKRHDEEFVRLREDMNRGFELVNRHISAIGARWGIMAEEAFRDGLRGLLDKELGLKVEKWKVYDESGIVFGYPSDVEVDVTVKDGRLILIEVSSHVRASDVFQLKKKAELYEEKTGRRPDRLLIVTPYADEKALEASKSLGIEMYTNV